MSVLESVASATPGVGFLIGGLIAAGHNPRATFLVAGLGILVVVSIAAYYLAGTPWTKGESTIGQAAFDADGAALGDSDNVEETRQASVSGEPLGRREGIG
jgi:hypothetical protein